jgi:hypothetical protein
MNLLTPLNKHNNLLKENLVSEPITSPPDTRWAACQQAEFSWPPEPGDTVFFWVKDRVLKGKLNEVRHGLLWTDFLLDDGSIWTCPHF